MRDLHIYPYNKTEQNNTLGCLLFPPPRETNPSGSIRCVLGGGGLSRRHTCSLKALEGI